MADLVCEEGELIHAILLALVAGRRELAVLPRRRLDKPAPAGGDEVGSFFFGLEIEQ
jgi:hypothetical protein